MHLRSTLLLASLAFGPALPPSTSLLAATTVVRGPYLQSATPTSMVVRWRTDATEASVVNYGLAADALTLSAKAQGVATEHIVQLTGLQPGTKYFYLASAGPTRTATGAEVPPRGVVSAFTTPPPPGPARPTRIWVLGDPGTKNDIQRAVRDVYYKFTGSRATDLWLLLGDNAYPDGTDADYQKAVFEMYPETLRTSPVWSTLGNHDAHSANSVTQSGVYYDVFTLPTRGQAGGVPSGTEAYYAFDYANIHFICLDSQDSERTPDGAMMQWLKADLAATERDWIIAFFHHPTYTKGTHDSDREGQLREMRQVFLPVLEAGGVDVILTGHSHVYERSPLLDGHYGLSTTFDPAVHVKQKGNGRADGDGVYVKPRRRVAHDGEVSVVTGSAGHAGSATKPPPLNHPAMIVSYNEPGSSVIDVDGLKLDLVFLNDKGEKRDWFTIEKR
jgi:hypothetical protein